MHCLRKQGRVGITAGWEAAFGGHCWTTNVCVAPAAARGEDTIGRAQANEGRQPAGRQAAASRAGGER